MAWILLVNGSCAEDIDLPAGPGQEADGLIRLNRGASASGRNWAAM